MRHNGKQGRGWQEVVDNMGKMTREYRMKKVLGVVILALRAGGASTANATGRSGRQSSIFTIILGGKSYN